MWSGSRPTLRDRLRIVTAWATDANDAATRSVSDCLVSPGRRRSGSENAHFSVSRVAASARSSSSNSCVRLTLFVQLVRIRNRTMSDTISSGGFSSASAYCRSWSNAASRAARAAPCTPKRSGGASRRRPRRRRRRLDVLVQCLRCPVVGRDVMPLPALLVEPEPPLAPLLEVVLPPHPQNRAHPREAVEHHREERPVSEPGQRARVDVLEELPRLGLGQDRRRSLGDDVLRPPHRGRRIHREDLADDEPVAEHADGGQVLLDGRDRPGVGPDVGGHVERSYRTQAEASGLAPPQELPHRPPVRRSRPRVRDPPHEELEEPLDGIRSGVDDQRRQDDVGSPVCDDRRLRGSRHQRLAHSDTSPPPPAPPSTSASNRS